MSDMLKYIQIQNQDGSYGNQIPLSVDSVNVFMANDDNLEVAMSKKADKTEVQNLQAAVGSPLTAITASAMIDTNKIYVYTGSETGYTNGDWYYWNDTVWIDGGVYNSVAIDIDTTPTQGSTNAVQSGGVYSALAGKVDAETGKGLSTNDYSDAEKAKVTNATADLSAITTATASDVDKALKAKTVSGGKVTEWEFGEAGDVDLINSITENKNLFNAEATTDGYRLNTNGENFRDSAYYISGYIPVSVGVTYTKNSPETGALHRMALYNSSKGFVRKVDDSNSITAEEGEAYIRFCGLITEKDTATLYGSDGVTAVDKTARNEIGDIKAEIDASYEMKSNIYFATYIIKSNPETLTNRVMSTDYIEKGVVAISCDNPYSMTLVAYTNDKNETYIGYYLADGSWGTTNIQWTDTFNMIKIRQMYPDYLFRIVLRKTNDANLDGAGIYDVVHAYGTFSIAGKTTKQISAVTSLNLGGARYAGTNDESDESTVRTGYLQDGIKEIFANSGYVFHVGLIGINSNNNKLMPRIYRNGVEAYSSASAIYKYGRQHVNIERLKAYYPEYAIRLNITKVGSSTITVEEAGANIFVTLDAEQAEADVYIAECRGRKMLYSDGYVVDNLDNNFALVTLSADKMAEKRPYVSTNGVSVYGQLYVDATTHKLTSAKTGESVQLKGICVWNIIEGSQDSTLCGLRTMRRYGANIVRVVCMPTTLSERGYLEKSSKDYYNRVLKQIIYDCISLDMYVLLDWHILHQGNPLTFVTEAGEFFEEFSTEFYRCPNILYEICNEPNGTDGSWENVKSYAETIIPVIRANCPDAVCIVGTPNYSADLQSPTDEPLDFDNVMYTYHFYKNSDYISKFSPFVTTLPVFVTEWGAKSSISGSGASYDITKSQAFLDVCEANSISWCAWALWQGDKENGSTFFDVGTQDNLQRIYGSWAYYLLNAFGRLVVDNFADTI